MKPDKTPTLKELETLRQKLVQDLNDAPQLFGTEKNGHELITIRAALNSIEKLLKDVRKDQGRQVA